MKNVTNKLYRNHSLFYKILLLIGTTFLIVYLFPKSGKFKYNFEKGKPWQSETLQAPFDFAIKKTDEETNEEKEKITEQAVYYFDREQLIEQKVLSGFQNSFGSAIADSLSIKTKDSLKTVGEKIIKKLYEFGISTETNNILDDRTVIILEDRTEVLRTVYANIVEQSDIVNIINTNLADVNLDNYSTSLTSLMFDIVKPNLKYNKTLSEQALKEELSKVSSFRGSIEKDQLIISKGEVVEGDKYQILKSLQTEFENQDWTKSNYYWIVTAYTLLVALALLMLLLFLRKYRIEVFENNTKVTFIFFNIIIMVILTTLVINYNSQYIYVVPICILPLVLKAFFDARLGLFAHVVTVLLLGSIVPNSYEYMFLQIIAGICI